jgi:hypothetical protein
MVSTSRATRGTSRDGGTGASSMTWRTVSIAVSPLKGGRPLQDLVAGCLGSFGPGPIRNHAWREGGGTALAERSVTGNVGFIASYPGCAPHNLVGGVGLAGRWLDDVGRGLGIGDRSGFGVDGRLGIGRLFEIDPGRGSTTVNLFWIGWLWVAGGREVGDSGEIHGVVIRSGPSRM